VTRAVSDTGPFAIIPEWVIYDPELSSHAVRVYAILARHADDSGACWPSRKRIASLLGRGIDSVKRAVGELEERGAIEVQVRRHRPGEPNETNVYFVRRVDPRCTGAPSPVHGRSDPRCTDAPTLGAQVHREREPMNESQSNENSSSPADADEGSLVESFERFWALFPKKVAKREAMKAWGRLAKKGADLDEVIAGLERHAAVWADTGTERQFIPYPATWLNREQWLDELDPGADGELDDAVAARPGRRPGDPDCAICGGSGWQETDEGDAERCSCTHSRDDAHCA
jgi:hypothetical protein